MTPRKKTKIALDENRMSILGVQILFGFQLQAPFQTMFDTLPERSQLAAVLAFGLLTGAVALLIAPSAHHRIVTRHGAEGNLQHSITWLIDISLLLLGFAIGVDLWLVGDWVLGGIAGVLFGGGFCLVAFAFWCGIELMHLTRRPRPPASGHREDSAIEDRIDYVLTEARVVLPGAQALLGFQLIVILTASFDALPEASVLAHLGALAAVAISAVLLIAPAAHHRIVFAGEDAEEFLPIASRYLLAATVFLALGMAADCYVIVTKVLESPRSGALAAAVTGMACLGLWHAWPLLMRQTRSRAGKIAGRAPTAPG